MTFNTESDKCGVQLKLPYYDSLCCDMQDIGWWETLARCEDEILDAVFKERPELEG